MISGMGPRAAILAVLALALAGCQDAMLPAVAPARPLVVASFYPLYDFARQIAGDRAEVVSLVPAGVEPHDWEPSPRDVARVEKAKVFIYNGAGFDPGAERLVKNISGGGTAVIEATAGMPLLAVDLPAHEREHGHAHGKAGHSHGKDRAAKDKAAVERDPHVWLDPTLARSQVETIRAGLAKADPANADHYAGRATTYAGRLTSLHEAFTAGLAECRRREIVVSHAAFTYLAHRYKLLQVPVMGMSPEAEPSPADLARAVRVVRRIKATVIFFETLVSAKLSETLAREVGARTLVLNPVEGLTADEEKAGKDYIGLMEDNLRNLRTALDCT
jgi:zinc transport system substrate-binding protein